MCLELKDCFFRWDGPYDETSATDKGICIYIYVYTNIRIFMLINNKRNILFTFIYKNIFILNHINISIFDIRIL